jgi:NAD(P)-dependent dehydrogenase (short-subunit alcohol dehydrogenase family)
MNPERTAIVTGTGRGLGLALAGHLAATGWSLVIDARTGAELEAARRSLLSAGARGVVAIEGDVADPDHARAMIEEAIGLGGLALLVNNASLLGPTPLPRLADYPIEGLGEVFEVNVAAPLRLIQLALPELRRNRGRIVNITSDAAVEGYEGWGGYGASKAALEQLSRVLAAEEPGIRVYWVDPGDMNTRMQQEAFPGEDVSDRPLPESRVPGLARLITEDLPSGRYQVEDLLSAGAGR